MKMLIFIIVKFLTDKVYSLNQYQFSINGTKFKRSRFQARYFE